ncbi:MAG: TrmH family RNA methyltransferase [Spirochaetia bacterium]|nr:TrmH family RNA methyltransferase [Spirochaetia bacterium]
MFTEKKFRSLEPLLRCRKAARILQDAEKALRRGYPVDTTYLIMILRTALEEPELRLENTDQGIFLRSINSYKYKLMDKAGIQVADWDMALDTEIPGAMRTVFPIAVYLEDIRSPFNVGSIFRTAESFCFKEVLLSPDTPTPAQSRAKRSAMGTDAIMEWHTMAKEELAGKSVFALETGGTPLDEFQFPKEGIMILGSEETGVSPELMAMAKESRGIVSIPIYGIKRSVNVGVAFGIAAQAWAASLLKS